MPGRAGPSVVLVPASGPGIGGGHVVRCLALAQALTPRGASCLFVVGAEGGAILRRFGDGSVTCLDRPGGDTALAALIAGQSPRAVVFDDYGCDASAEAQVAAPGRRVMAIDDLADRDHACDLLLDPGFGREPTDLGGRVPAEAQLLLGPTFALLRPAFAKLRPPTPPAPGPAIARVFVSFGLSDVGGVAGRAVSRLLAAFPEAQVDVALSASAESLPILAGLQRTKPGLTVHLDATNVATLMAGADLAVGAGGSGTWERACLGLPTLAVAVADNQRPLLRALADRGALVACDLAAADFEAEFAASLDRIADPGLRGRLAANAFDLCDGRGAERAADALLSGLERDV